MISDEDLLHAYYSGLLDAETAERLGVIVQVSRGRLDGMAPEEAIAPILRSGKLSKHRVFDGVCPAGHRLFQVIRTSYGLVLVQRWRSPNHWAVRWQSGPTPGKSVPRHRVLNVYWFNAGLTELGAGCGCLTGAIDERGLRIVDMRKVGEYIGEGTRRAVIA